MIMYDCLYSGNDDLIWLELTRYQHESQLTFRCREGKFGVEYNSVKKVYMTFISNI